MNRIYALKRLLEHGALNQGEIVEIMGGNPDEAMHAISFGIGTHQIYCSNGSYSLNKPAERRQQVTAGKEFALQGVW